MQRGSGTAFIVHLYFFVQSFLKSFFIHCYMRGIPRDIAAKVLVCAIVETKSDIQSRCCVHFRTNTLGERYELPFPNISYRVSWLGFMAYQPLLVIYC